MLHASCEFDTGGVNATETCAEQRHANGSTSNTTIGSNDEPAGSNQLRIGARGD